MVVLSAMQRHRVLVAGFLSSFAAAGLMMLLSAYFERASRSLLLTFTPWIFPAMVALGSSIPCLIVVVLATRERRTHGLSWSARLGLFFAVISLVIPVFFTRATILLWIGMRHEAARNIPAPAFEARDLKGTMQRLSDHKGEVVLVNVWATWCVHCLSEMPKLDQLYQAHKNQGLVVFGLSGEDAGVQRKGLANLPLTYSLLTNDGEIPSLYHQGEARCLKLR